MRVINCGANFYFVLKFGYTQTCFGHVLSVCHVRQVQHIDTTPKWTVHALKTGCHIDSIFMAQNHKGHIVCHFHNHVTDCTIAY